jgi:hypothetical protein
MCFSVPGERLFEVLFFVGIAGCVVTVVVSWYSILKELAD